MKRRPGAVVGVILALALALLTTGCGNRPETPEELFREVARLNQAGDSGRIWDLMTDDARKREMDAIDGYRAVIRGNPNDATDKIFRQYKCSRQEVLSLSYVELWKRENQGKEQLLANAKVLDRQANPQDPDNVYITFETAWGDPGMIETRRVDGGWALVRMQVSPKNR